ncbi:allophanate hydrolase [Meridianimarinicoccus roseus]|jgi:anti-sigma factor ChrR (cupin superfamily)|uniref:Allophanate hydrolase n=1 Tax=Meridianimarinicoccus roseus TaxID=2072018 RepID=A0A2V2LK16_9RHOB|nr:cupin domain-containing protein [Meridianimarinicoccus roseus]PWR02669.1 allophanate hydrolase [Meridianimarinicoccus roseus]
MAEARSFPALLAGGWRDMVFEPFRDGVEICRLVQGPPDVALLRYSPGATVPLHSHPGLETVLVLDGAQTDENGRHEVGALVVNPPGTQHSVRSDQGCTVLIQWERPVRILDDG